MKEPIAHYENVECHSIGSLTNGNYNFSIPLKYGEAYEIIIYKKVKRKKKSAG